MKLQQIDWKRCEPQVRSIQDLLGLSEREAKLVVRADVSERPTKEPKAQTDSVFAVNNGTLEIRIDEQIGYDFWTDSGITASAINQAIKDAGEITAIQLYINSPGGSLFEGTAIYNLLKRQDVTVNVAIEGLAASAASVVAMAGDTIHMATGTQMMVHRAWAVIMGNAQDAREFADLLDKFDGQLAKLYASRTGQSEDKVMEMLTAETWLDGEEAVGLGFADSHEAAVRAEASVELVDALAADMTRLQFYELMQRQLDL
jgi:ATP-dependent protease ClpP protease subunit